MHSPARYCFRGDDAVAPFPRLGSASPTVCMAPAAASDENGTGPFESLAFFLLIYIPTGFGWVASHGAIARLVKSVIYP